MAVGDERPARHLDDVLQPIAEIHVHYELKLLAKLARSVPIRDGRIGTDFEVHPALESAFLEAFMIHARTLDSFLRVGEPSADQPLDVVASDYFDGPGRWKKSVLTKKQRDAISRQVAHISSARLTPVPWQDVVGPNGGVGVAKKFIEAFDLLVVDLAKAGFETRAKWFVPAIEKARGILNRPSNDVFVRAGYFLAPPIEPVDDRL